jgi:xanthine dehydrogenase accessory factor
MLLELAQSAIDAGEQSVLATVVRLDGSGYGRPGARLLITESGERAGYISGGCLEKDLCHRVWDATANGSKLIAFDTRGNALSTGAYNTGCDGIVYVLCQRIQPRDVALAATRRAKVFKEFMKFATVYRSESRNFQTGDAVAVHYGASSVSDCLLSGGIDPEASSTLCRIAGESVQTKSVVMRADDGARVEIFVEMLEPPNELVVFGAGDDVLPVYHIANQLGWSMTIVGRRAELADPKRFPRAQVISGNTLEIAARLAIGPRTKCLLMTHDFDQDVQLLPVLLDSSSEHIGILGPKRRLGKLIWQVAQRGRVVDDSESERIHAPIGLDIGAANPQEIAISIAAEFIARSRDRTGGFLHDRRQMLNASHVVENQTGIRLDPQKSPPTAECQLAICKGRT